MKYTKTKLTNGLRIVTAPMKDNPTVTVMVLVEAGSKYEEKGNNGISHFLEHMCFKGTTKRQGAIAIARELDLVGAEYNAFTSHEHTGYYAKADARHLDLLLDVVSDLYLDPTLPAEELEREKGVIIEEINMYEDEPRRNVHDVFMDLVYGDQPVGWKILGPKENIRKFKREDFIEYRNKHYVAQATTVVVAGNIAERQVIAKVKKIFASIPKSKKHAKLATKDAQSAPALSVVYKDIDQAHMVLGVRSFDLYSKHIPTLSVLNAVLSGGMSGRLWQRFREELGICYYVKGFNDNYTDHGIYGVWAGVDKNRTDLAIREICNELSRLAKEPVGKGEFDKAKKSIIGRLYLGLESSDDLAQFYGGQEIHREKIRKPKDIEREIMKVTPKDVQSLAKKIFTDATLNCAIIGPFKDDAPFRKALTFAS